MPRRHVVVVLCAIATLASIATESGHASDAAHLQITSTLDGKAVLPHRISWRATTNARSTGIREVDFLIDGKLRWVEHKAPYVFGSDGDWLVTSFLTPGVHRFAVRAKTTDGRTATDVQVARVITPGTVPANIGGNWQRQIGAAQAGSDLAGTWHLRISPVGWSIIDPKGGPSLIDVAYLGSSLLESRGPIWTGPMGAPGSLTSGNGWCDAPFPSVRYRVVATASTLTLHLVGSDHCGGEHAIWAGVWNRSS